MMAGSVPSAQDVDPYAERRAHARVSVDLPAFLQAGGDRHSVHLVDLSAAGAKLTCPASLPAGTAVTLDCGTLRRAALVRWQNGGFLGLCFDCELDAREISALVERSSALAALRKSRA